MFFFPLKPENFGHYCQFFGFSFFNTCIILKVFLTRIQTIQAKYIWKKKPHFYSAKRGIPGPLRNPSHGCSHMEARFNCSLNSFSVMRVKVPKPEFGQIRQNLPPNFFTHSPWIYKSTWRKDKYSHLHHKSGESLIVEKVIVQTNKNKKKHPKGDRNSSPGISASYPNMQPLISKDKLVEPEDEAVDGIPFQRTGI